MQNSHHGDPTTIYLKDLRKINLMTQEQVIQYATLMRTAQEHIDNNTKDKDQWEETYKNAKDALINANVRLVVSIAKTFLNRGLELADLIQEGNKGLITAVEHYDGRMGNKFSTYAIWWIRQALFRVMYEKSKIIRAPVINTNLYNKAEKYSRKYQLAHGRQPSTEEISKYLKVPKNKVDIAMNCCFTILSFDRKWGNDEDNDLTIEDSLKDTRYRDAVTDLSHEDLMNNIHSILNTLKQNEKQTLIMRFGLDTGISRTLEEIGEELHLSNERIRQIERKALAKLRLTKRAEKLEPWLNSTEAELN